MSEDSIEDVLESVGEGSYLERLDADKRETLITQLNARIDGRVLPGGLFGLLLVMLDLRPACGVTSVRRAVSLEKARDLAENPESGSAWDPLGQFLELHDIPYELLANYTDKHAEARAVVNLNYNISFDQERLDWYARENTISPTQEEPSRADERLIGELFGYPDAAIDAFCDRDHLREGHLIETISEEELMETLEGITEFYDLLDVDYRSFTMWLLPYVVPATAPECLDRIRVDMTRSFVAGLVSAERYECTVFDQVVRRYKNREEAGLE